jgi:putative Mn2+ efflux pump MntP
MDITTLIGTAFALAMDAFAVAVAAGVSSRQITFRQTFRLSWHFGFFQFMMPVIGWIAGLNIRSIIEQYDHWVAFLLLLFVGGNMIREAFQHKTMEIQKNDSTKGMTLVILSVATSIDALAVGLSFAMLKITIWFPAVVIGIIAALSTGLGVQIGKKVGASSHIGSYADAVGGIVLIGIGMKILHQHGILAALL